MKVNIWFQMGHVSRWNIWIHNNMNWRELRGHNIEILPFIRIFPPWPSEHKHPRDKNWTIHFGWLIWTVGIHCYL